MVTIGSLVSPINFFSHRDKSQVDNRVKVLTQNLRPGDSIKVLHTPYVLPLGTSNEIGGYARSLGLSLGPKLIAVDVDRLLRENPLYARIYCSPPDSSV